MTPYIASGDLCALRGRLGEYKEEPPLFMASTGSATCRLELDCATVPPPLSASVLLSENEEHDMQ